jgi:hypothetical protein
MSNGTDGAKAPIADAPNDLRSQRDEAVNCGDMKRVQDLLDAAIARIDELEAELAGIKDAQEDARLERSFNDF